jgi:hypothetical protein
VPFIISFSAMSASSIEAADGPPPDDVATYYTKTAFIEAASRILAISSIQAAEAWDDLKGDLGIFKRHKSVDGKVEVMLRIPFSIWRRIAADKKAKRKAEEEVEAGEAEKRRRKAEADYQTVIDEACP